MKISNIHVNFVRPHFKQQFINFLLQNIYNKNIQKKKNAAINLEINWFEIHEVSISNFCFDDAVLIW